MATAGKSPEDARIPEPGEPAPEAEDGAPVSAGESDSEDAAGDAGNPEVPAINVPAQCLTFELAGDEYGVGILQVREIIEYESLTPVPTTPPWIRGVMNLRGTVVPVIDLAVKFGLAETEVTRRTCIVIVEVDLDGELAPMGVMVDAVVRVVDLAPGDVEPPPAFGTRVRVDYLLGVGKVDGQLVLVLDADRVLSVDELLEVAAAPDAAAEAGESAPDGEGAGVAPAAEPESHEPALEPDEEAAEGEAGAAAAP